MIIAATRAALKHGRRLTSKRDNFCSLGCARTLSKKSAQFRGEARRRKINGSCLDDWFCADRAGVSFGYNTLVVDMISFQCMKDFGVPAIYDATHSIQSPGGGVGGKSTGGKRDIWKPWRAPRWLPVREGIFMECHPVPRKPRAMDPMLSISSMSGPL